MRAEDIAAANAVALGALSTGRAPQTEASLRRAERRVAHLQRTDPGGAWVAGVDGEIVGVALALVREGIWGLSLFAVAEAHRDRGIGRELLEASFGHGADARGHLILSTESPAAMRRYARLGLDLRPCVAAAGIVDRARLPAADGVVAAGMAGSPSPTRSAAPSAGRATGSTSRSRSTTRRATLLLVEDRAFAVVRDERIMLLAGLDDAAATRVLQRRPRRHAARRDGQPRLPHGRPGLGDPRVPRRGARRSPPTARSSPAATSGRCGRTSRAGRTCERRPDRREPARGVARHAPSAAGMVAAMDGLMMDRALLIRDIARARRAALRRPRDRQPHARRRGALDLRRGGEPRPADRVVADRARREAGRPRRDVRLELAPPPRAVPRGPVDGGRAAHAQHPPLRGRPSLHRRARRGQGHLPRRVAGRRDADVRGRRARGR